MWSSILGLILVGVVAGVLNWVGESVMAVQIGRVLLLIGIVALSLLVLTKHTARDS